MDILQHERWEWQAFDEPDPEIIVRKARRLVVDPNELHFTHAKVSPLFRDGRDVVQTAGWLWASAGKKDDLSKRIPPMVVVKYMGRKWSRSNRRLKCFKLAGVREVLVLFVDFDHLSAEHQDWFKCRNKLDWFANDRLDVPFFPYSDCAHCGARCRNPSNLARHTKALHGGPRTSGIIVRYNRAKGRGMIDTVVHKGIPFCWAALPKRLQFAHPNDLCDSNVSFSMGRKCGAWNIKMVEFPGRTSTLALQGTLLRDYGSDTVGSIIEYDHDRGFGFIEAPVLDLQRLFFHHSELPFQLLRQKDTSVIGAKVEFKLVQQSDGRLQAKRHCLVSPPYPRRIGYSRVHTYSKWAGSNRFRRDECMWEEDNSHE